MQQQSTPQDATDDRSNLVDMVLEHITPNILAMKPGEITKCEGLFDPGVWKVTPPSERKYVYGDIVSKLVKQGKVPLELFGISRNGRHNLYRRIDIKTLPGCGGFADNSGDADSKSHSDLPPLSDPEEDY